MSTVTGSGDEHIESHFFIIYKRLYNTSLVSVMSYLFISSTPKDEKYSNAIKTKSVLLLCIILL